ncbi:1-acyl-sn-glycerol-3-phosphate acyltransferase [bacterium]|nr:1-acyl-sn-glycerol-3-phosphate acyltransferase [bacterium]
MFHYFLVLVFLVPWTAIWITLVILGKLVNPSGYAAHACGRMWAWGILATSRIKLEIDGLENINKNSQYIFISNHTSAFDIPAIYWGLKNKMGMLAKKQLKYVPFFGWAMWAAGHFFVDRKNHKEALAVMDQVTAQLAEDKSHSLAIFVEGTRSLDGQLSHFKKGAFLVSLNTGIPIVPVVINGAFKAKGKKDHRIVATTIRLSILAPMNIEDYGLDSRQKYIDDARDLFVKHYEPPN